MNELIQFHSFSKHLKSCKKLLASATTAAVGLDSCSDKIPKLLWKTTYMHMSKKLNLTWPQTFLVTIVSFPLKLHKLIKAGPNVQYFTFSSV